MQLTESARQQRQSRANDGPQLVMVGVEGEEEGEEVVVLVAKMQQQFEVRFEPQ